MMKLGRLEMVLSWIEAGMLRQIIDIDWRRIYRSPAPVLDFSLASGPVDHVSDLGIRKPGFFPDHGHGNAFFAFSYNPHHRSK